MNVLVVGPSWVGDTLIAQPLFQLLKQNHPKVEIDVLAPSWTQALLARMPEVRQSIVNPFGHGSLQLSARRQLGLRLRHQYQQAIVLPNSWKSALLPWHANIALRTGYTGEARWGLLNDRRQLDSLTHPQLVERYAALALPASASLPSRLPLPALISRPEQQQQIVQRLNLDLSKPVIALCPGAEYGTAKRWPAKHFATLAQALHARGATVWLIGSGKDQALAQHIMSESQNTCINLCGLTNIAEAVDLLAIARLIITNDSGLMHVSAAVGRPLIAIYGSSSPLFTPPLSPQATLVNLKLPCSPCFKRECPLGHLNCLHQITPEHLISQIDFDTLKLS
jgi:heptosyltransferase-2